jgi:hypothetical protein
MHHAAMTRQMQFDARRQGDSGQSNASQAVVVIDKDLPSGTCAHNSKHYRLFKTINVDMKGPDRSRMAQNQKNRPEHDERRKPERQTQATFCTPRDNAGPCCSGRLAEDS